jgi:hypothetical protein
MTHIVAARFETFDAAQNAALMLVNEGVTEDCLHTFYVNPPGAHQRYRIGGDRAVDPDARGGHLGAVAGGAIVGLIGALIGVAVAFVVTDAWTVIIAGAGVGAYIGSLFGAMYALTRGRKRRTILEEQEAAKHEAHHPGVLLAVREATVRADRISEILRAAGGAEVEHAQGRWENGRWQDFDPLVAPNTEKV